MICQCVDLNANAAFQSSVLPSNINSRNFFNFKPTLNNCAVTFPKQLNLFKVRYTITVCGYIRKADDMG